MATTKIDWRAVQRRVGASVDGNPGRDTWGRVIAIPAGRKVDATIERLAQSAAKHAAVYDLTTAERVAEFLAQIANETGGFRRWEENLNYSAVGLATTWPGRYAVNPAARVKVPNSRALALARRPEAIGNDTYALRMGNLDSAHDNDNQPDGWQYRGRGALQLTGRGNYALFGQILGLDLVSRPELASDPFNSLEIALEFFRRNKVLAAIDAGDYRLARFRTNGGYIGVEHVAELRAPILEVLAA